MSPPMPASRPQTGVINAGSRPYRSHKVRACDLCRKRKSRCTVDIPGQSCLLCRVQGADCHYQEDPPPESSSVDADTKPSPGLQSLAGHKRRRVSELASASGEDRGDSLSDKGHSSPSLHRTRDGRDDDKRRRKDEQDPQNESVLIVGPVAAEDAQVIEKYMPSERSSKSVETGKKPYKVYSNDPRKPVLYTTVSRRRQGVRVGNPPGETQKEILEQILGPFRHDLVRLYVEVLSSHSLAISALIYLSGSWTDSMLRSPSLTVKPFGKPTSRGPRTIRPRRCYVKSMQCPWSTGSTRPSWPAIPSQTFDMRST